jgi:hypothetical protein
MTRKILFLLISLTLTSYGAEAKGLCFFHKKKANSEKTEKAKKETDYDKLFKEKHVVATGFITLHQVKGKLYFEFPLSLLGREMLIGSTISEISDNGNGIVGSKPVAPLHVTFTKQDNKIQLRQVNCDYIAKDPHSNIAKAIEESSIGAIMNSYKIEAYSPDSSSVVFEMTNFFVSDSKEMPPFNKGSYYESYGYTRNASFQSDKSYLGDIKAFSDNLVIKSFLTYTYSLTSRQGRQPLVTDQPFTALMTRSIVLLGKEACQPRTGDYRMAIFPTEKYLFDDLSQDAHNIYFSNRWRLEPSDTAAYIRGEKVEPLKPIVFYIDNNFPEKWKKYIREGVEQWNEVFEEVGFKNVISAKDFPQNDSTFDPDNIKYNCIRYAPINIANAMGPSWTDPRSGEIINASVYVYHNIIELLNHWLFVQTSQTDQRVRTKNIPDQIIGDGLRYVISHEVGHCLGLMHQMSGSSVIPVDSLRSPSFTQKYGTTTSIMDYARFNYVAQPGDFEKGVRMTPPRFGVYDHFSIKWLYTWFPGKNTEAETDTLNNWIRERSADPVYRFGKQQGTPLDPASQTEDLGDDALKASDYGIKNLKYILPRFSLWVDQEDDDYSYRGELYDAIVMQYMRYLNHVYANIGGVYLQELKKGDTGISYRSVPKEKQQKALQFMLDQVDHTQWLNNKELSQKLPVSGSVSDLVENSLIRAIMAAPQKVRFSATLSEDPYSFQNCTDDVYQFTWRATLQHKKPTDVQRKMQKAFIQTFLSNARLISGSSYDNAVYGSEIKAVDVPELFHNEDYTCSCGACLHEAKSPFSTEAYGSPMNKLNPMLYNESECFEYLLKVQGLLKRELPASTGEIHAHYELLLQMIQNALKAN